jgi:hypothetical protein
MTVPGIPVRQNEVDFYSREYPIESQNVDYSADRQWAMTVLSAEAYEHRKEHEHLNAPLVAAARHTGDIEPTVAPNPELDPKELTEMIRQKARDMGFAEVGFTYLNRDYVYKSKKTVDPLRPRHVPGHGAGVRADPDHPQHGRRAHPFRHVPD